MCIRDSCGNVKNDELGISIHNSPDLGSVRLTWKRFVSIHRKDFNPVGKFAVCSEQFTRDCFTLAFPMRDMKRNLKKGTFPTIWKKSSQNTIKAESTIGEWNYDVFALCLSPLYLFPHLPVTWFFLASLFNIRVMNALTICTSHIVACVFILFCFLLIVIVKRTFALSGREVNFPIPRPFHSSVKFRKSEAT